MSVSLVKGQRISLSKEDGSLEKVVVGLGWDVNKSGGEAFDLDASAFALIDGKLVNDSDIVYFRNLKHRTGAIKHMGDNLTGEGDGDDEQIKINLNKLPEKYDRVVIVVNIYQAYSRNQNFGKVDNAFIRLFNDKTGKEICKYNLSGKDYLPYAAMIFGEVYRHNGEWKFSAIGQGSNAGSVAQLSRDYR